jgi:subtilisin family serine protease
MAAPIVAGQAALLRQAQPRTDPSRLIEQMRRSARKLVINRSFGAADPLASIQRR